MIENELNERKPKKYLTKRLKIILLSGVIAIAFTLFIEIKYGISSYPNRMIQSQAYVIILRHDIDTYKDQVGKYPDTLEELYIFVEKNPESDFRGSKIRKEYISDESGNCNISSIINGEGGWYYDNQIGRVGINLDKPSKKYLPFLFGPKRNTAPCIW